MRNENPPFGGLEAEKGRGLTRLTGSSEFMKRNWRDRLNYSVFDKNSLWGELNKQKRQLCVKKNLAQDLRFICGPFQNERGER